MNSLHLTRPLPSDPSAPCIKESSQESNSSVPTALTGGPVEAVHHLIAGTRAVDTGGVPLENSRGLGLGVKLVQLSDKL